MENAIYSLVGVVIGALIVSAMPLVVEIVRDRFRREYRARYVAIRIICILDRYIDGCISVIYDDGTSEGQPAGEVHGGFAYHEPVVKEPDYPNFDYELDWNSIEHQLIYDIFMLPEKCRSTDRHIQYTSTYASPPDFSEYFGSRQAGYAKLGMKSIRIVDTLRERYRFPKRSYNEWGSDFDPRELFQQHIDKHRIS